MMKPYVYAMRIFLKDEHIPMAELAIMEDGEKRGTRVIEYCDVDERDKYTINSYTYVWDEREVVKTQTFDEYY